MTSSIIFQTEIQCLPTQIIIVDCTSGLFDKIITPHCSAENHLSYLNFYDVGVEEKRDFILLRDGFVDLFMEICQRLENRYRCVVWFVGDIDDECSNVLMRELPIDVSNRFYWQYKYVPSIFRFMIDDDGEEIDDFLDFVRYQYFDMPEFDSLNEENDDNPLTIYGNQYDCVVVTEEDDFVEIFELILELHLEEVKYIKENKSFIQGSGGKIQVLSDVFSASISPWRRVDWFSTTQTEFFLRLWNLKNDKEAFLNVLNYRSWKGRFISLNPRLNDTLSSDEKTLKVKRREKHWDHVESTNEFHSKMPIYKEANNYRINYEMSKYPVILISCLHRRKDFEHSLRILDQLPGDDDIYLKSRGITYLSLERKDEAVDCITEYTSRAKECLNRKRLFKSISQADEGLVSLDLAKMYLHLEKYSEARTHVYNGLKLLPENKYACKIIVWICMSDDDTTFEEQEIIFNYLVKFTDPQASEEYYDKVYNDFKSNPVIMYFCALYHLFVLKDSEIAEEIISGVVSILPDNARVLQTYATLLCQLKKKSHKKIENLFEKSLSIEPNIYTKTNYAAFLLSKKSKNEEMFDRGIKLLDTVLYSLELGDTLSLSIEAWFLSLVYKPLNSYVESLQQIKLALRKGGGIPTWDFSMHVAYAKKAKLPDSEWLGKLVSVINLNEPGSILHNWPRWKSIKTDHFFTTRSETHFEKIPELKQQSDKKRRLSTNETQKIIPHTVKPFGTHNTNQTERSTPIKRKLPSSERKLTKKTGDGKPVETLSKTFAPRKSSGSQTKAKSIFSFLK